MNMTLKEMFASSDEASHLLQYINDLPIAYDVVINSVLQNPDLVR